MQPHSAPDCTQFTTICTVAAWDLTERFSRGDGGCVDWGRGSIFADLDWGYDCENELAHHLTSQGDGAISDRAAWINGDGSLPIDAGY